MAFGRTLLTNNSVFPTRVSADGSPKYKSGGATIDWSTVTALGADANYPDGSIVRSGNKVLRYGQVVCKITTGETQTITGTATSGSGTLTLVRPDTGATVTTAAIAFNATAATVLAAIQAVMAPGQAVSASGGALGTSPVVITFSTDVATMTVNAGTLAGGTFAVAATTNTGLTGFFGPYDPAASDGRQLLNSGRLLRPGRDGPAILGRFCRAWPVKRPDRRPDRGRRDLDRPRAPIGHRRAHAGARPHVGRVHRRLPAILARKELTRVLTPPIFRRERAERSYLFHTHSASSRKPTPSTDERRANPCPPPHKSDSSTPRESPASCAA
jgi:hypothetical protein